MQNDNASSLKAKKFQFPGSTPHYPPLFSFSVDYMMLKIKPDFDSNTLKDCTQKLRITACEDISEIKLDIAEIDVHQVISSSYNTSVMSFDILKNDDKLIITLGQTLQKGNTTDLTIRYSAGYYHREDGIVGICKPRSGFYFVSSSEHSPNKQAWTQGQASESKYWFPCIDDPQVKFPREIQVTVPENDFIVISNGELLRKEGNIWTWIELNPTPAYLTSVVIGKFDQEQQEYSYCHDDKNMSSSSNSIPLIYYWPKEIPKKDAMLTFANTPNMMRFFEEYFGDLVTCRDWSNIWLNEGFATYCETLYWESIKGFDEFCYKVMKIADEYLEESRRLYKRPLVTTIYKHPDDLFDSHSYEKGGCILHMLRNDIGDNNFRRCINNYLNTYKNKTSETDDLRKIVEDVSRKSMRRFFDQWVYRSGHPQLDIEFSLEEEDSRRIKIKIRQIHQEDDGSSNTDHDNPNCCNLFEFTLDIRIVFSTTADIEINNKLEAIYISQRITEHSIEIPKDARIEWISIDPQFKILKEIKSIKITNETNEFQLKEMLKKQLRKGKTIIERIEAARALKNQYSEDVVDELHNAVIVDPFYGVSIEAANTLGSYHEKNNYAKANKAYVALFSCLDKEEEIFSRLHPEIKQAIVRNIGQFEREESINLLEPLLHLQNESYFLRANAATAIGKSSKNKISSLDNMKKEKIIALLKETVILSKSFRNVIANGAIDGLKEFSKDIDKDMVVDIANFLIENTNSNNEYFKRLSATSALSKFLHTAKDNDDEKNTKLEEMNQRVFNHLLGLLKDKRRKVKINACKAFADNDAKPARPDTKIFEVIDALVYVAEHDLDGFIRREAERCVNIMRVWIKEWSSKPPTLDIKLRKEQIS